MLTPQPTILPSALFRRSTMLVVIFLSACATVDVGSPTTSRNDPEAGVLTLPSGRTIGIFPELFNFTGQGLYQRPDGVDLSGEFISGKLHGMGSEEGPEESYTGQWESGLRHGHGELRQVAKNRHYRGDFQNGLAHGSGTETSTEGTYDGSWANGKRHGRGRWDGQDGDRYIGSWAAGTRSGFGSGITAQGARYEGDWLDDKEHGFGVKLFDDGKAYDGEWSNGKRDGYGRFSTTSALTYEGTWRDDKRHGFGRETRPDRSYFEGEWDADRKHGEGSEVYADGRRHDGAWENNFLFGPGTRTHRSGITITGPWNQDTIAHGLVRLPGGAEYAGPLFEGRGQSVQQRFLTWLTEQAAAGDAYAQLYLASAYLDFNFPERDTQAASIWLEKSAAAGVPDAQFRLGVLLMDSDRDRHVGLMRAAAEGNHPRAHELLGEMHHIGSYVSKDLSAAATHYGVAIEQGSVAAVNNLAWLLATTADETFADPERAIEMLQPIVLFYGNWQHLDTLAAAQARAGNLEIAIRMQRQALLDARDYGNDTLIAELESRLALYEAGEFYTE